jgi:ribosome biogenesis SPOUT family RNA methylase Rps3
MAPKYIIEHMEEGFSSWVKLEYLAIAKDVGADNFWLSSVSESNLSAIPKEFTDSGIQITSTEVTNFQAIDSEFDKSRVCLLDPSATEEFTREDSAKFDYFLFGGILGDHPPRDRTGELRKYGFVGRHLGKIQMTTDTAVRVTNIICSQQSEYKCKE